MLTTRDEFSLRRFSGRGTRSAAFNRAIEIYRDTTGGGVKTDATQIVYWAERPDQGFSGEGDQIHALGLVKERDVVGFALSFYLPERKLFVVDHIAMDPTARSMTAFERFCDLIARYVRDESLDVDYCVGEISIDINDADPLLNAETLTRLLQIKGFRVVDTPYLTPSTDRTPPYHPVPARLLLYTTTETRISKTKVFAIIEAMHRHLYQNWYRPFAQDFEKYCIHLSEIRDRIALDFGNKEYALLQGHPPFGKAAVVHDLPQKPLVVLAYVTLAVILAGGVGAFTSWAGIGLVSIVGGAVAVAICTLAVLALWYEGAAKLVRYGIDAMVKLFGKRA